MGTIPKRKFCFVLMPFRPESDAIYHEIIKPTVQNPPVSLICVHGGELFGPKTFIEDVQKAIGKAEILIAELTGANPNVCYEVGYAHAVGKPVIQIAQSTADIPSNLRHIRTIIYDDTAAGGAELGKELRGYMKAVITEKGMKPAIVAVTPPGIERSEYDGLANEIAAYVFSAKRYGMSYETLNVRCSIELDGSATIHRRMKLQSHTPGLAELTHHYLTAPDFPAEDSPILDKVRLVCHTPEFQMTKGVRKMVGTRHSFTIRVSPALQLGQVVEYSVTEWVAEGTFAVNLGEEECKHRQQRDYFGWEITRPTGSLVISVDFPRDLVPSRYGHEVWYPPAVGSELHETETRRTDEPTLEFKPDGSHTLKQIVPYPSFTLTYIAWWAPLGSWVNANTAHNRE